jgi:hypothetical protein
MAVAFDSGSSTGSAGGVTLAHTCTGSNLILLLFIIDWTGSDNNILTANPQYNGVAMTLYTTHAFNTARIEMWYLVNPATGTHNITYSNSGPEVGIGASFSGVDTANPFGTVTGSTGNSSTPTSASLTIPANDMFVDGIGILCGTGATIGSGFTQIATAAPCNPKGQVGYKAGGGTYQDVWTGYTQDSRWANLALQLKAPSTKVPGQLTMVGVGS